MLPIHDNSSEVKDIELFSRQEDEKNLLFYMTKSGVTNTYLVCPLTVDLQ
jgi:hypothetical protein